MKKPLLSVIIPTLNEEKFIVHCLKSLDNQTIPRKNFEIIVSDTRSQDNTVKLAKPFADKIVSHNGIGAGFGKNYGAKLARSNNLAFLDADSIALPTWVQGAIQGLKRHIACTGPVGSFDARGIRENLFFWGWDSALHLGQATNHVLLPGFNMAIRKTNFKSIGGFLNGNVINEDMDLSKKLWKVGAIGFDHDMRVLTSARRVKELGISEYVLAGARFVFFNQNKTWQEHRKDTRGL